MRMGRKKSEAVAGQNGRLKCGSRLEIKQHTSWQVSVLVLFGSLFPFLTVPPPSLSLPHLHADTERMRQLPSFSAGQQSKCEINSLVPALRRSGYIHTHIRR